MFQSIDEDEDDYDMHDGQIDIPNSDRNYHGDGYE